jgi:signal peptidase
MFARRVMRVGTTLLLAAGLLLGALMVLPALAGYQRYVIVSGSMTGTYDRGSVVFDRVVPTRELKVGAAITYRPPASSGVDHLITHRIQAISLHHGVPVYRTKGDANPVAVPYVGFAIAALSDRRLRMLVVGLPALLIAVSSLVSLWRPEPQPA